MNAQSNAEEEVTLGGILWALAFIWAPLIAIGTVSLLPRRPGPIGSACGWVLLLAVPVVCIIAAKKISTAMLPNKVFLIGLNIAGAIVSAATIVFVTSLSGTLWGPAKDVMS